MWDPCRWYYKMVQHCDMHFYEEGLENKIKNLTFVGVVKCMMGNLMYLGFYKKMGLLFECCLGC